jgi:hypothetical protein
MSQYKVLKKFKGIAEGKLFVPGETIEFSAERADEINKKLPGFIEEVSDEKLEDAAETVHVPTDKNTLSEIKAYLDKANIEYDDKAKKGELLALIK